MWSLRFEICNQICSSTCHFQDGRHLKIGYVLKSLYLSEFLSDSHQIRSKLDENFILYNFISTAITSTILISPNVNKELSFSSSFFRYSPLAFVYPSRCLKEIMVTKVLYAILNLNALFFIFTISKMAAILGTRVSLDLYNIVQYIFMRSNPNQNLTAISTLWCCYVVRIMHKTFHLWWVNITTVFACKHSAL